MQAGRTESGRRAPPKVVEHVTSLLWLNRAIKTDKRTLWRRSESMYTVTGTCREGSQGSDGLEDGLEMGVNGSHGAKLYPEP
jgi:hypothetical protein